MRVGLLRSIAHCLLNYLRLRHGWMIVNLVLWLLFYIWRGLVHGLGGGGHGQRHLVRHGLGHGGMLLVVML